jgi:hypothetical protein
MNGETKLLKTQELLQNAYDFRIPQSLMSGCSVRGHLFWENVK